MIENLLKEHHIKVTYPRVQILKSILEHPKETTLKELVRAKKGSIDKSTIYRVIDLFISEGIIEKFVNADNEVIFLLRRNHGHYLTCIKCHRLVELDECPIEKYISQDIAGFKILHHVIRLEGICSQCQKNKK